MKELSIEQKAKAYDEAKLQMSAAYNSNRCTIGFMNEIFPELKESEDERIRKALIEGLREMKNSFHTISSIKIDDAIAWLEKDEQKPAWSEEDEKMLNSIISSVTASDAIDGTISVSLENHEKKIDWLKSLKDRVQLK